MHKKPVTYVRTSRRTHGLTTTCELHKWHTLLRSPLVGGREAQLVLVCQLGSAEGRGSSAKQGSGHFQQRPAAAQRP